MVQVKSLDRESVCICTKEEDQSGGGSGFHVR